VVAHGVPEVEVEVIGPRRLQSLVQVVDELLCRPRLGLADEEDLLADLGLLGEPSLEVCLRGRRSAPGLARRPTPVRSAARLLPGQSIGRPDRPLACARAPSRDDWPGSRHRPCAGRSGTALAMDWPQPASPSPARGRRSPASSHAPARGRILGVGYTRRGDTSRRRKARRAPPGPGAHPGRQPRAPGSIGSSGSAQVRADRNGSRFATLAGVP
jgi:hypothetical protein